MVVSNCKMCMQRTYLVPSCGDPGTLCTIVYFTISIYQYCVCMAIVLMVILVLGFGFDIILYFVISTCSTGL